MKRLRILTTAATAALLMASSVGVANANPAQSLSVAQARTSTSAGKSSDLGGTVGAGAYVVGAVMLGLIIWGVIDITDDDPDSP